MDAVILDIAVQRRICWAVNGTSGSVSGIADEIR